MKIERITTLRNIERLSKLYFLIYLILYLLTFKMPNFL